MSVMLQQGFLLAQDNPGGPHAIVISEGVTARLQAREPFAQSLNADAPPTGDLLFNWNRGDSLLAGEDEADLKIHKARLSDSDSYTFFVSDQDPPIASNAVSITVLPRDALDQWEFVEVDKSLSPPVELSGVASGPDLTIAVGRSGSVRIVEGESDAIVAHAGTDADLFSITYLADWFYAVGSRGTLIRSQDGLTWETLTVPTERTLYAIHGDAQGLVAVGRKGVILISTDGTTWMERNSGTRRHLRGVVCSEQGCVVVGSRGVILFSADREIWENVSSQDLESSWSPPYSWGPANLRSVAYGDGLFVAVGGGKRATSGYTYQVPEMLTSTDGKIWNPSTQLRDRGYRFVLRGVTYRKSSVAAQGEFVGVGSHGLGFTSADGVNWSSIWGYSSGGLHDITTGADDSQLWIVGRYNHMILGREGLFHEGIEWFPKSERLWSSVLYVVGFSNGFFHGTSQAFEPSWYGRSANGADWDPYDPQVAMPRLSVSNGSVYVGDFWGTLRLSADGENWNTESVPHSVFGLAYTGSRFIASRWEWLPETGITVSLLESTDGENWKVIPMPEHLQGVTYFDGFAGGSGQLTIFHTPPHDVSPAGTRPPPENILTMVSTLKDDGTWTTNPVDTGGRQIRSVEYGSGHFLAVGEDGLLLSSTDGTQWRWRDSGTNSNLHKIAFGNGVWMIEGARGTLLRNDSVVVSPTGVDVENVQTLPDGTLQFEVRGPTGQAYRIDYSSDLKIWTPLTTVTLGADPFTVEDPGAANARERYYRIVPVPPNAED